MKKIFSFACAALVLGLGFSSNASAAEGAPASSSSAVTKNPTCVLMKFTDDTRFQGLDTSDRLSENLMVKLLQSGQFNLQEHQQYVNDDIEKQLTEDNYPAVIAGRAAIEQGDFSAVFESPSFADVSAQTLSTAGVGQTIAPAVTAKIGAEQNADYLIQGTVLDIGVGSWEDLDFQSGVSIANAVVQNIGGLGIWGGILGNILTSSSKEETGFGILADVRIIKAATGEIVWSKRVYEKASASRINAVFFSSGESRATSKIYDKTVEKVSDKIMKELLSDMKAHKLFQ